MLVEKKNNLILNNLKMYINNDSIKLLLSSIIYMFNLGLNFAYFN